MHQRGSILYTEQADQPTLLNRKQEIRFIISIKGALWDKSIRNRELNVSCARNTVLTGKTQDGLARHCDGTAHQVDSKIII